MPSFAHRGDHLDHLVEILVGRIAPGRPHAESRRALGLGRLRRLDHLVQRQQLLALQARVVFGALRAVGAVLGTGAGLDRQQGADLNPIGIEIRAVHRLRAKQQVVERQRKQCANLVQRPVVARVSGCSHFRSPRQVRWGPARRCQASPHDESGRSTTATRARSPPAPAPRRSARA